MGQDTLSGAADGADVVAMRTTEGLQSTSDPHGRARVGSHIPGRGPAARERADRIEQGEACETAARALRERALLRRIHLHGDLRARAELAEDTLPLARALAGRYANRGEPFEDLLQVACVGVMKAIDGFDVTREVRFSSYATPTVLGEIKRHFRDKTWAVRVPRPMQELQLRVARARDKLTTELGRLPAVQEIAATIDAPFGDVVATVESARARRTRSLDEPIGEDGTLADTLGGVDPEIERAEMRALLDGAFGVLPERDQDVLRMRFEDDMTQMEIGQILGVSQMQISRLIYQSLARVRLEIERSPGLPAPIGACEIAEDEAPSPAELPVRDWSALGLPAARERIAA
jgi:RNA polymerase sigma-B factor